MKRFPSCSASFLLFVLTLATLGCGSGRKLQTVSLSPPTADAKNFPNGQVPFTATGTFSQPPSPVTLTSKDVVWCVVDQKGGCVGFINPGVIVDQNGMAQCNPTFVGTATVLAGNGATTSANPDGGSQLKVFGLAQMTCP